MAWSVTDQPSDMLPLPISAKAVQCRRAHRLARVSTFKKLHAAAAQFYVDVPASLIGTRRGPWQVVPTAGFFFVEDMMTEKAAGSLSIRTCRLEDIDGVLELWRQAEATPSVTDTAADLCRAVAGSQANVLVGEVGGQVVGSIIGTFDGWRGNIYRLAVRPDHRRRGIARALVAEVEKRLARQGARRITALVEKDHPLPMAFWEAVGYRLDQRIVRRVRNV
jgi:ribosomal protein S18 acetylase RimI-like enzyme